MARLAWRWVVRLSAVAAALAWGSAATTAGCGPDEVLDPTGTGGSSTCPDCPPEGDCKQATCDNGCAYADVAAGSACDEDGGIVCDGQGSCVECLAEEQCAPEDLCLSHECVPATCVNGMMDPGEADADCGGECPPCDNGSSCAGPEDCLSGFCAAQICQACLEHAHCDPLPGTYCDDPTGGSCVPDKTTGSECGAREECTTNFCADGFCCGTACNGGCDNCDDTPGICAATAAGALGTPSCSPYVCDGTGTGCPLSCTDNDDCVPGGYCELDPPDANVCKGAALAQGSPCNNALECASGHCVDGFCCDLACDAFCEACSAALTSLDNGACALIDNNINENSPSTCAGIMSCDGFGNCKEDNGQPCTGAGECSSGFCVENFCCNTACTGACRSCRSDMTAAADGTCAAINPAADDNFPVNVCAGAMTCDAAGNCKKDLGETCAANGDCASNMCVDDVCCVELCDGLCEACSAVTGACDPIPMMTDPDEECTDPNDMQCCDGSGMCGGLNAVCDI